MDMTGVIYHQITHGSFDGDTFQDFLISLLKVMKPYPAECSVLIMDNCAIHNVEGVAELCADR